ncbi:EndoU domain-containing protein [Sneathiella sp.]|uniref:EndoU domain-containing protein n=1 Tax=Sneathiella sp. TaxID=1964365 RepID=UPI00262A0809|nr:EndoU domain-containing protein [Sneathiella sp.]MDF2367991.1 EndoU domain-containing protein [Sneathiella sp.]
MRRTSLRKVGVTVALLGCLAFLYIVVPLLSNEAPARGFWTETSPSLNLTHIFDGEINRHGKPVGFHVAPKEPMGATSRIKHILSGPNHAGVYTAMVEIYDSDDRRWKEKFSSFFPDDFSRQQVVDSILFAHSNNRLPEGSRWRGPSGHGFLIEGYRFGNGDINTAYPLYAKD